MLRIDNFINRTKRIQIPGMGGMSFYFLLDMYIKGIVKGALTSRAGGVSFSFFMAIFPFFLFFLTLIPYIPIENFPEEFVFFIEEILPPNTYEAVESVLKDIANNRYGGLLSFGFVASIFLMSNGVNAIFGSFEYSYHTQEVRSIIKAYFVALGVSILLSIFFIFSISISIFFEIIIVKLKNEGIVENSVFWIGIGRFCFLILMLFLSISILYYFGTKESKQSSFFSAGSFFTTILSIITFYFFQIYIEKFATYNELYGSIGSLLIIMVFIWLNSIILLLGFELNASLNQLRKNIKMT